MRLDIVTIFPEYFAPLDVSLLGKARRRGDVDVHVHDLRDWAHDRHRTVDDTPYGGGPGMVMKPEPWGEVLDAVVPPPSRARLIVEAVTRLLPGVLGNADSVSDDSFAPGRMEALLEGPVYTKPATWRGRDVPDVLMSGNHAAIARWRRDQALRRTAANRPELVARNRLDEADRQAL